MKRIFIALIGLTTMAHAQVTSLTVKDFNFSYTNPSGEGRASHFVLEAFQPSQEVHVRVERDFQNFIFRVSGAADGEFTFANAPSFMTMAHTMDVSGFNLGFQNDLKLSLKEGSFISDDSLLLQNLELNCRRDQTSEEMVEQVLKGCIKHMSLRSSQFSSSNVEGFLSRLDEDAFAALAGIGIQQLALDSKDGSYNLSANVRAQISGKVRSKGSLSYNDQTKVLSIRISEVKFSIFNITSKVFDELKKMEDEKLVVRKPYVYLTLK